MTHEELRDRLLDLACGELSPRDAREVEEHAAACEGCRAELAAMRGTRQVMAALPVEPAPARGESILVAAARESVRARRPRSAWPRWLWAAPVVVASVAAAVALSLRLSPEQVPSAAREDPDALRGAPYAAEPPAAGVGGAGAVASREPGGPAAASSDAAARRESPRALAKRAEAPPREVAAERRFATPPPAATADRPDAPLAAAPAPAAPAAPPLLGAAPSPAPAFRPPPSRSADVAGAEPRPPASEGEPAPSERAPGAARYASGEPAEAQALAAPRAAPPSAPSAASAAPAAPAPVQRAKKALPEAREAAGPTEPRARAVAAATARARSLGLDPTTLSVVVEGPASLEDWRGERVSVAAPVVLEGRRFWAVAFTPAAQPGARAVLTVFVEDGTFRALADVRGK